MNNEKTNNGGIYMWTCNITNRSYIGQTQDLNRRKKEFLWFGHYHYAGKAINRARKKYNNAELWEYRILETCNIDELPEKENFYVNLYNTRFSGYNETDGGDGPRGYHHSNETKKKISYSSKNQIRNSEINEKVRAALIGHIVAQETRNKISATLKKYFKTNQNPNKGKKGKECSWCRIIGQYDKITGEKIKVWYGTKEIERENPGFHSSVIVNVCRGRKKTAYGYVWKYID